MSIQYEVKGNSMSSKNEIHSAYEYEGPVISGSISPLCCLMVTRNDC